MNTQQLLLGFVFVFVFVLKYKKWKSTLIRWYIKNEQTSLINIFPNFSTTVLQKKTPFFRIYILLATIIFEYKLKTYLAFFSFTQEPLMCCVLIVWWDPYLYFKKCVAVVFLQSLMTNYLTEDRLKFYVYDTKTCCFLIFCFTINCYQIVS